MIVFPNSKINIGLNIVSKRDDGFHNIETIFYPIDLSDILEIIPSKQFDFTNSGILIDSVSEKNLCVRAYNILKKDYDIEPVEILLHKIIPFGAGLGGGSSDAASVLLILNDLFKLNLSEKQLLNYASELGSDCSFFIKNKAVFAKGKGNEFEDISLDISKYQIHIVKPNISVNTSKAYSQIYPQRSKFDLRDINKIRIEDWRYSIVNDFEKPIFKTCPEIKEIKNKFYENGAIYASMSGSGSSVFGIFKEDINLEKEFDNCFYFRT